MKEKNTKNTLITQVYEKTSLQLKDVRCAVDTFVVCLIDCLEAGETVEIRGLGVFSTEKRGGGGRKRFNLQKKKVMAMEETSVLVFTPSKSLKKSLNENALSADDAESFENEKRLTGGALPK